MTRKQNKQKVENWIFNNQFLEYTWNEYSIQLGQRRNRNNKRN